MSLGASEATPCAAGIQVIAGATVCTPCASGYYQTTPAERLGIGVPAGYYASIGDASVSIAATSYTACATRLLQCVCELYLHSG